MTNEVVFEAFFYPGKQPTLVDGIHNILAVAYYHDFDFVAFKFTKTLNYREQFHSVVRSKPEAST